MGENSREASHWGPCTLVSFTSRSSTRFSEYISEKNPPTIPAARGEKELFLNTPKHFVLLNKAILKGGLVNQSLTCWSIIRA